MSGCRASVGPLAAERPERRYDSGIMTPVLSRAEMRAFDAHAVAKGLPSIVLMENAGRGTADVLVREALSGTPTDARVVVVCGAGNNGGDGMVSARHLLLRGARRVVCLVGDPRKITPDARTNFDAWVAFGGEVRELAVGGSLWALSDAMKAAAVVVDALFGTGLDRTIDGWLASVVGAVNDAAAPCVAVDLPSGLDADTGATLGVAVQARTTVTFAHPKLGLLTPNGAR